MSVQRRRASGGEVLAAPVAPAVRSNARERILTVAYSLFCRHGIQAVGIDTIIAKSGVAKMTVYRHFRSKDDLVLAVLERREDLWTHRWLEAEIRRRADRPTDQLLAIFDVFDEWFHKRSFEGCLFINVLLEIDDRRHPLHRASRQHLAHIRTLVSTLATEAGIAGADAFASQWHILMKGSIVAAAEGDVDSAQRARALGQLLLDSVIAPAVAPSRRRPSSIAASRR
jgi:AcrR family transcriptional regulator